MYTCWELQLILACFIEDGRVQASRQKLICHSRVYMFCGGKCFKDEVYFVTIMYKMLVTLSEQGGEVIVGTKKGVWCLGSHYSNQIRDLHVFL